MSISLKKKSLLKGLLNYKNIVSNNNIYIFKWLDSNLTTNQNEETEIKQLKFDGRLYKIGNAIGA